MHVTVPNDVHQLGQIVFYGERIAFNHPLEMTLLSNQQPSFCVMTAVWIWHWVIISQCMLTWKSRYVQPSESFFISLSNDARYRFVRSTAMTMRNARMLWSSSFQLMKEARPVNASYPHPLHNSMMFILWNQKRWQLSSRTLEIRWRLLDLFPKWMMVKSKSKYVRLGSKFIQPRVFWLLVS